MNNIVLSNNREKPFGPLRNDYMSNFMLDDNVWNSVDAYVYTNLIPEFDLRRTTLLNQNPKNIEKLFFETSRDIQERTLLSSIKRGIEERLNVDPLFKKLLLEANGRILYVSPNPFFGVVTSKINVYGKYLEFYSKLISKNALPTNRNMDDDYVYDLMIIEKGLTLALYHENLEKYMKIAGHKKPLKDIAIEIISELINTYGVEKIMIIDKEASKLINANQRQTINLENIKDLSYVILLVKKNNIENVKKYNEGYIQQALYDNFILENVNDPTLLNEVQNIPLLTKLKIQQRLYSLFKANLLSQTIMTHIKNLSSNLFIPSNEEVLSYKNFILPVEDMYITNKTPKVTTGTTGTVFVYPNPKDPTITINNVLIQHSKYDYLSPTSDVVPLMIDEFLFPSISHYMIIKTIQNIPTFESLERAYSQIHDEQNRFYSVKDLELQLQILKENVLEKYKNDLLGKALKAKFSERYFKDILFATGEHPISFKKETYLSKITLQNLEKIRESILPEPYEVTDSSIEKDFGSEAFFGNFIQDKCSQFCFFIKAVQTLIILKNKTPTLTEDLIKSIMNGYLEKCTTTLERVNTPYSFEKTVLDTFNIGKTSSKTTMTQQSVSLMYSYIHSMFKDAFRKIKLLDLDRVYYSFFKNYVIWYQYMSLKTKPKNLKYFTDVRDKFTASALLEIIRINSKICNIQRIDEKDVFIAGSVLVGSLHILNLESDNIEDEIIILNSDKMVDDEEEQLVPAADPLEEEEFIVDEDDNYDDDNENFDFPEFDEDVVEEVFEGEDDTIESHLDSMNLLYKSQLIKYIKKIIEDVSKRKSTIINFYA